MSMCATVDFTDLEHTWLKSNALQDIDLVRFCMHCDTQISINIVRSEAIALNIGHLYIISL